MAEIRDHGFSQEEVDEIRGAFRAAAFGSCFFRAIDPCAGLPRACHFLKRQRITPFLQAQGLEPDLVFLARWDPRNAVPSCEHHDNRFDGHAEPPLRLSRAAVPEPVEWFAADWGLEWSLERDFA